MQVLISYVLVWEWHHDASFVRAQSSRLSTHTNAPRSHRNLVRRIEPQSIKSRAVIHTFCMSFDSIYLQVMISITTKLSSLFVASLLALSDFSDRELQFDVHGLRTMCRRVCGLKVIYEVLRVASVQQKFSWHFQLPTSAVYSNKKCKINLLTMKSRFYETLYETSWWRYQSSFFNHLFLIDSQLVSTFNFKCSRISAVECF